MLVSVNRHNFRDEVLQASHPVLVNFWSNGNDECKSMRLLMTKLEAEMTDDCSIVEIDWSNEQELTRRYGVYGVPSLLVFENGRVVARYSGMLHADEIKELNRNVQGVRQ